MCIDAWRVVADVVKACAWPTVVVWAAYYFRTDVRALAARLRKGWSAEFDPPAQATVTAGDSAPTSLPLAKNATNVLATLPTNATVSQFETVLRDSEPLKGVSAPAEREQILFRLLARSVVIATFEVVEANIFASQVALLNFLNSNRNGLSAAAIKGIFYDPAVERFPGIYANYPFEGYLAFLQRFNLVVLNDALVQITQQGIDYLTWRIEQAKVPRLQG